MSSMSDSETDTEFYVRPSYKTIDTASTQGKVLDKNKFSTPKSPEGDNFIDFDQYLLAQSRDTTVSPVNDQSEFLAQIDAQIATARQTLRQTQQYTSTITSPFYSNLTQKSAKSRAKLANMDKLGTCRKFSGYPKDNGEKFLKEFQSFSKLHELDEEDDDARKLAAFHLHLMGPALTWYNGLDSGLSWDTVRDLFCAKYVTIGWQHPSVIIESETFQNMVLGPAQDIEDFYCQILEKGQLLSKPEQEIMLKFINGLPDKLAFYVRTSKPADLTEALSLAKTGEAYKYRVHETSPTVSAAKINSRSDDIAELKYQVGELTSMFKQFSTEPNTRPVRLNQTTEMRKAAFSPVESKVCHGCNCPGHIKKYCNWNGTGNVSPQCYCQLCKQCGHTALQCNKYSTTKTRNTTNVCQICFKFGHIASDCFKLQPRVNQQQQGFAQQRPSFSQPQNQANFIPQQGPSFSQPQNQANFIPQQGPSFSQPLNQENLIHLGDTRHGHPGKPT